MESVSKHYEKTVFHKSTKIVYHKKLQLSS